MNNSYDRDTDSRPWWQDIILDRIDTVRQERHNAVILEDYDSADAHAIALDELETLCLSLGIDVNGKTLLMEMAEAEE